MGLNQMNMQNQLMYHNMDNISIDLNEMGMGMQKMINPMSHSMNQQMEFMYGPNIKENNERKNNNSDHLCVIFRTGDGVIMVQCLKSEKVSDLIQKYRNESGDSDCSKKFIFNGKQLNGYRTVAEAGIEKYGNIFVSTICSFVSQVLSFTRFFTSSVYSFKNSSNSISRLFS